MDGRAETVITVNGERVAPNRIAQRVEPKTKATALWSRHVNIDGSKIPATIAPTDSDGSYLVFVRGDTYEVSIEDEADRRRTRLLQSTAAGRPATSVVRAPMPGLVKEVLVSAGDRVEEGEALLILEAMKMENEICADATYIVASVEAEAGSPVEKGVTLVRLDPPDSSA